MSEPHRPCDNRGPRIGEDGTRCRRPSGHVGDHATAPEDGFGDVRWSQWADPMTSASPTQPPAAPETDVSALREALEAADLPWRAAEQTHGTWYGIQSPYFALGNVFNETDARLIVAAVNALPALLADLTAARERVRVVEGERDAAMAETEMALRMHDVQWSRAESAEAAHAALVAGVEALAGEYARRQARNAAHNGNVSCSVWGIAGAEVGRLAGGGAR